MRGDKPKQDEAPNRGLPSVEPTRFIGVTPDGRPVLNVHQGNRFDVDPDAPTRKVMLTNEDGDVLDVLEVPSTREHPDIIRYKGVNYIVVDTMRLLPVYRECMTVELD